jgi:hypothetical protein
MADILPTEWPPRPGDVWLDKNGSPWFAVHFSNEELDDDEAEYEEFVPCRVEGCEPHSEHIDDVRRWWGPLTLAYRVPAEQAERDAALDGEPEPDRLRAEVHRLRALVEEALHLRMHGERAPGGTETWPEWDRKAGAAVRGEEPPGEEAGPC